MATADPLDVRERDVLERVQAACLEMARLKDADDLAQGAVRLALDLTRAAVAFMGLIGETGAYEQVYSRSATGKQGVPLQEAESLIASAASTTNPSIAAELLEAAGEALGTIGVSRPQSFSNAERQAFALFAHQVAASLQIARLRHRRQEMVDTLINLRADLERTARERLVAAERAESAARVERAHELAVQALLAVSVHARSGHDLTEFYRGLTESVARLVGAGKVLFWEVDQEQMLSPIAGAYGIDDEMMRRFYPTQVSHSSDDIASRVVYQDLIFRAHKSDGIAESARVLGFLGVSSAISVPWRAGEQRLGLVAAYESTRALGFSREDSWVLQKAALAAGLVWQLKLAESDLKETVDRLRTVDAARQMLLKTVSTAVDNERKRFANQLHDDALQKLTAAELQLQRLGDTNRPDHPSFGQAQGLLSETEDALRRLLFEVRPPALESPGGLQESVRDRLAIFRSLTGIEAELELDLPSGLSYEFKSMVFRQVAEAITNIEKHAGATQVQVSLTGSGGAVQGVVIDNGRGFVVAERNNLPGHMGLLALRERALMAGGWYKIESRPGLGTRIEFWMPIAQ